MSIVWTVIVSYALINLTAGILELIRKRKEVYQDIDQYIDELKQKTNSDLLENTKFVKMIIVSGTIFTLIYDILLWAPDNLVRNIYREMRE